VLSRYRRDGAAGGRTMGKGLDPLSPIAEKARKRPQRHGIAPQAIFGIDATMRPGGAACSMWNSAAISAMRRAT
jgi:hypothetical protein